MRIANGGGIRESNLPGQKVSFTCLLVHLPAVYPGPRYLVCKGSVWLRLSVDSRARAKQHEGTDTEERRDIRALPRPPPNRRGARKGTAWHQNC